MKVNADTVSNTIKLLIYKETPSLLENVDFEDDNIFLEPMLFAYFNSKRDSQFSQKMLTEIMQGYFIEKVDLLMKESRSKIGIAYLPKLGYFDENKSMVDQITNFKNTDIELITHKIVHLSSVFKNFNDEVIDYEKIEISKELIESYRKPLENAVEFIKNSNKDHFELIEQCCRKIVLFKSNPANTNSFATINAHGIAFFNAYQDDYDEVFFVDDIAHQTGHIIMTTKLFERKDYFILDENIGIGTITNNSAEYRSFYILFHALYTYYTTIMCLDSCLEHNVFYKKQIHETNGRIGFYLLKYKADLLNLHKVVNHYGSLESVLTVKGIEIYKLIEGKYFEINKKYVKKVEKFDFRNQPYNFTFKNFLKQNPLENA